MSRVRLGPVLACGGLLIAGCTDPLGRIDADVQALIDQRTEALGPSSRGPEYYAGPAQAYLQPGDTETEPVTANPPTSELRFDVADEGRDIASRLEQLSSNQDLTVGQELLPVDLPRALEIAQQSSREYRTAEEDYILAAIRLLIERHLWSPRLFNDTSAFLSGSGDDGDFSHALDIVNTLRVTQRLPYGGEASARWVWNATEQLRNESTGRYRQSSELIFDASIPLLRGAGTVAREALIQAERSLVYGARSFERFRRQLLVSIARDYFDLLNSQARIANLERQLKSLLEVERSTRAKVEAGILSEFQANNVANQVLSTRASLASQRESYVFQVDRFKVRLGLPPETNIKIEPFELQVPDPDISLMLATQYALQYRLDLQNTRDRVEDARRAVRNAKNDELPDLDLAGEIGVPTDPDAAEGGVAFDPEELDYSAGFRLSLPLDRKIERLETRQAVIGYERSARDYDERRDSVVIGVRSAVRTVELNRFQLQIAEEQVKINRRRQEEQRIKADEVTTQERLDTENELLDSENARDRAQTDLRNSVLEYLLESGQLRVRRDGRFDPLPGMPQDQPGAPVTPPQ